MNTHEGCPSRQPSWVSLLLVESESSLNRFRQRHNLLDNAIDFVCRVSQHLQHFGLFRGSVADFYSRQAQAQRIPFAAQIVAKYPSHLLIHSPASPADSQIPLKRDAATTDSTFADFGFASTAIAPQLPDEARSLLAAWIER